jgi:nitrogenase molybdenum-iron protein alpha/beta subunit
MDIQFCHIWDVKEGQVTRFQQYVDTAKLREVMGARWEVNVYEVPSNYGISATGRSVTPLASASGARPARALP